MARTRAQLSEKQERILVQCQLMGLTTSDMTQISNRLRALDKEREFKREVDKVVAGASWEKHSKQHYVIKSSEGRIYDCTMSRKQGRYSWDSMEVWTVKINHPGTRMKERVFTDQRIFDNGLDEIAGVCPDKDKRLFRLLRCIYNGEWK